MKAPNELENHLRSWTPRRPSPAIEQRVFRSDRSDATPNRPQWTWAALRLAPAPACLIVSGLAWNAGLHHMAPLTTNAPITLAMTSNVPLLEFGGINPFAPAPVLPPSSALTTSLEHNLWVMPFPALDAARE